jgi:hypothetical protein
MYDIKVLNNKCKMGGGDVGPQCFVKDLLRVKLYGVIDLDHFSTTSVVFCIKITKNVRKKDH